MFVSGSSEARKVSETKIFKDGTLDGLRIKLK